MVTKEEKEYFDGVSPYGTKVFVKCFTEDIKTSGGIYKPTDKVNVETRGIVLAVGSECEDTKVGDVVQFSRSAPIEHFTLFDANFTEHTLNRYISVFEKNLLFKYNPSKDESN